MKARWAARGAAVVPALVGACAAPAVTPPRAPPAASSSAPVASSSAPAAPPRIERHVVTPANMIATPGPDGFFAVEATLEPAGTRGVAMFKDAPDGPTLVRFEPGCVGGAWHGKLLTAQRTRDQVIIPADAGAQVRLLSAAEAQFVDLADGFALVTQTNVTRHDGATGKVVAKLEGGGIAGEALADGGLAITGLSGQSVTIVDRDFKTTFTGDGERFEVHGGKSAVAFVRPMPKGVTVKLVTSAGVTESPLVTPVVASFQVFTWPLGKRTLILANQTLHVWEGEKLRALRPVVPRPAGNLVLSGVAATDDGRYACTGLGEVFVLDPRAEHPGPNARCVARRTAAGVEVVLHDLGVLAPKSAPFSVKLPFGSALVHGLRDGDNLFVQEEDPPKPTGGNGEARMHATSARKPRRVAEPWSLGSAAMGTSVTPFGKRGWLVQHNSGYFAIDGASEEPTAQADVPGNTFSPDRRTVGGGSGFLDGDTMRWRSILASTPSFYGLEGTVVRRSNGATIDLAQPDQPERPAPSGPQPCPPTPEEGRASAGYCGGNLVVAESGKPPWVVAPMTHGFYRALPVVGGGVVWDDTVGRHLATRDGLVSAFSMNELVLDADVGRTIVVPEHGDAVAVEETLRAKPTRIVAVSQKGLLVSDASLRTFGGRVIAELPKPPSAAAFSSDGRLAVVVADQRGRLYDTSTGAVLRTFYTSANRLSVLPDRAVLVGPWTAQVEPVDPAAPSSLLALDAFSGEAVWVGAVLRSMGGGDAPPAFATRVLCRSSVGRLPPGPCER